MTQENQEIYQRLEKTYPDAHCELDYHTPIQLVTATILSAQTTDKQVNKVTSTFFQDYPDLEAMLTLSVEEIEEKIRSIGFYHNKAKNLYLMWREVAQRFHGEVPSTMEELVSLPGVGRKTANVVLANAFHVPAIAVDTHVFRVSNRIGIVHARDVEKTEFGLREALDPSIWSQMHHLLIFHGRRCCHARGPACDICSIADLCETHRNETEEK